MPSQWKNYAYVFVNLAVANIFETLINNFCQIEPGKSVIEQRSISGFEKMAYFLNFPMYLNPLETNINLIVPIETSSILDTKMRRGRITQTKKSDVINSAFMVRLIFILAF